MRHALLLLLLVTSARALTAQDLSEVRRLAQQGQQDSAYAAITEVLARTPATDTAYAEVLYTAGNLAPTTSAMRLAFQRVVTEQGRSAWADDALLRLAQIDYAVGDHAGAVEQVERLRADYPASPLLGMAALWGARAWFARDNIAAACVLLADGIQHAGDDVELRNQLAFYQGRCGNRAATATPVTAPDTVRREPPAPVSEPPVVTPPVETPASTQSVPAPGGPTWRVQLAAVGTAAAASEIAARARRAGFEAVVIQEGGYHKVRAGAWTDRDEAVAAIPVLRERFGGSPFLVREP